MLFLLWAGWSLTAIFVFPLMILSPGLQLTLTMNLSENDGVKDGTAKSPEQRCSNYKEME
jgi:CRISPR/Cas system CMR-associated protein Cmr5 small subunit